MKNYKEVLPVLNTLFLAIMAFAFASMAMSTGISVPERITTVVERTKEVLSFEPQDEVETSQTSSEGFEEALTKDYACYERIVDEAGVNEYGFLVTGDLVNRLATAEGWTYVEFSDQANVRHANECWIWI